MSERFSSLERAANSSLPYESDDDVRAAYLMVDVPALPFLRVVGGARYEDWRLNLTQGTPETSTGEPISRHNKEYLLWSANVTWSLSDRQNLRLAAYNTVARPDPREVSPDYYAQVTGDCGDRGDRRYNVRESSTPTCAGSCTRVQVSCSP